MGDVNIDIRSQNEVISNNYLTTLAAMGFIPCINQQTRITNNTGSCIDHIFITTKNKNEVETTVILETDITDHYPTIISLKNNTKTTEKQAKIRETKKLDYRKITDELNRPRWHEVTNIKEANEATERFTTIMQNII